MIKRLIDIEKIVTGIEDKENAVKNIVFENDRTNGVIWFVPPGKEIPAHFHPATDDIWVVIQGQGEYYLGNGQTHPLRAGMMAIAEQGQVHGVKSTGDSPLIVVAISAPMPVEMIKVDK